MWQKNCQMWYIGTTQCDNGIVKYKKKNKRTTKCEKQNVKCDVRNAQCENGTVKCEKENKGTTKCDKKMTHVMLELYNVRIEPSNVKKKKK